jgi:hypothetical protein
MKFKDKHIPFSLQKILPAAIVMVAVALMGVHLLTTTHADTPYVAVEAESGALSGGATINTDSSASGGESVLFNGSSGTSSSCTTYTSTSTSAGCGFPSATTTGVPSGTAQTAVASKTCSYKITTANAVINGITTGCIDVEANNVTITSDTWWGIHSTTNVSGVTLIHDTIGDQGAGKGPD